MTTNELIEKLSENLGGDAGIVISDNKGREFTIKDISMTMGGCFHSHIELEEIDDPQDKWFRTAEVYAEELERNISYHESEEFRNKWLSQSKSKSLDKLLKIIDGEKRQLDNIKKNYKPNEIID